MKILFSPSEMKSELSGDPRICEQNFTAFQKIIAKAKYPAGNA